MGRVAIRGNAVSNIININITIILSKWSSYSNKRALKSQISSN